jgi:hypothetical protein
LTDILIEELHNHLYLKSPYCENRWKEHASQQVRGVSRESAVPMGTRQLYQFLDQLDTDAVVSKIQFILITAYVERRLMTRPKIPKPILTLTSISW